MSDPKVRLEELRVELRAERLSYGELAELQGLVSFVDPGDVELLEAAGVPEQVDVPFPYEVVEAVGGEWIVLRGGFQVGGEVDRSGAGNRTFSTKQEAIEYVVAHAKHEMLPDQV